MSTRRRIHLGIDYGTSASKIVFRDYGAPGGEMAFVVRRNGSFRIPSRVCVTPDEMVFADDHRTEAECDLFESVKTRVAWEVTGEVKFYFGVPNELPQGFRAADLAALSMWYLISEGYRAIEEYLETRIEGLSVGATMGIPMAFFRDSRLRAAFLKIARRAWCLYRSEGPLRSTILIEKAQRALEKCNSEALDEIPEFELRNWIRSEAEAAMWWPFQSPAIPVGPYAKIDIGAGTTHASLYRIYSSSQGVKGGIAFFGASSVAVGMDALDRAIATHKNLGGNCLALRGMEDNILRGDPAVVRAVGNVTEDIYLAYRQAWIESYRKMDKFITERKAWDQHMIFAIGGGSLVSTVMEVTRRHPGLGTRLEFAALDPPEDLLQMDKTKVPVNELAFLAVAYGLSNIGLSIPEVSTPDQVPPMPDLGEQRRRLDSNDIYAK